jgi:hypothetical protein
MFQGEIEKSPATWTQRGRCLGRTVGRVIPRRVASPQSPTPFHPAGSWYQRTSRRSSEADESNEDRLHAATAWFDPWGLDPDFQNRRRLAAVDWARAPTRVKKTRAEARIGGWTNRPAT